jgi:hypothetical protein
MTYAITGLDPAPFAPLFGQSDAVLAAQGVIRVAVEAKPSAPCRITLEDAEPGETVLLLNHEHLAVDTPYRSRHAIYVRETAAPAARYVDEVPPALAVRLLALRAFDADDMMIDAEVTEGVDLPALIERFFADPRAAYLHAHYARRGCFAARVDRG